MSSQPATSDKSKVRVQDFAALRHAGKPIVAVTAYDAITGAWADGAGCDLVLVGDSLANTALGLASTIPIRLEAMLHHAAAVARGVRRAFLVGDMPFMTCKISPERTLEHCGRMIQEGAMEAIKLEGGSEVAAMVERLVAAGIPVLGHIGLLPQSHLQQGGYRVQGRDAASAAALRQGALDLAAAGAFAVVLEGIPGPLAGEITADCPIPTIGIGAGVGCDGQVLVLADLLGMLPATPPRFVKAYANLHEEATRALRAYADDVRAGRFPDTEHTYGPER